jgi:hypothetical protein
MHESPKHSVDQKNPETCLGLGIDR